MPDSKLLGTSTSDAMNAEGGNDSVDFIKQTAGKEPLFSFSRTGDNPVQWIQLIHALEQPAAPIFAEIPGWPLLAPIKAQMLKCEKCAREFCSPINYRRHIRVHRRSLNFQKEPQKYRDLLAAFWDKLSSDEAKAIVSFDDVNLEEVPGSSIVRNITVNLRKPIFLSLPQAYVKAGSTLVDVIQGTSSRLPISSPELFSILDDASEGTFLFAGTPESLKKYVFDGEAGKIGLEMKNLIACTCFLVEQKLIKAWIVDKDAEALRCQKLLVEEEEAAQKRQAELLERKRQRKLRQKEQRAKDEVKVDSASISAEVDPQLSIPRISAEVDPVIPDNIMPLEPVPLTNKEVGTDIEAQSGCSNNDYAVFATSQNTEEKAQEDDLEHFEAQWEVPKSQKGGRNSFSALKSEQAHKHREQRAGSPVNASKVWTKKPNSENFGGGQRVISPINSSKVWSKKPNSENIGGEQRAASPVIESKAWTKKLNFENAGGEKRAAAPGNESKTWTKKPNFENAGGEQRAAYPVNESKVWTKKPNSENVGGEERAASPVDDSEVWTEKPDSENVGGEKGTVSPVNDSEVWTEKPNSENAGGEQRAVSPVNDNNVWTEKPNSENAGGEQRAVSLFNDNNVWTEKPNFENVGGEQRAASLVNESNVWTKKPNSENAEAELVKSRVHKIAVNHTKRSNCKLMIGSIPVTLRNCGRQNQANGQTELEDDSDTELEPLFITHGTNRSNAKYWTRRRDTRNHFADRSISQVLEEGADQTEDLNGISSEDIDDSDSQEDDGTEPEEAVFSIDAAEAFLIQRWKDASYDDHVELLMPSPPEHEPPGEPDDQASESEVGGALGKAAAGVLKSSAQGSVKAKFRTKA